jgi:hypothetical protein
MLAGRPTHRESGSPAHAMFVRWGGEAKGGKPSRAKSLPARGRSEVN